MHKKSHLGDLYNFPILHILFISVKQHIFLQTPVGFYVLTLCSAQLVLNEKFCFALSSPFSGPRMYDSVMACCQSVTSTLYLFSTVYNVTTLLIYKTLPLSILWPLLQSQVTHYCNTFWVINTLFQSTADLQFLCCSLRCWQTAAGEMTAGLWDRAAAALLDTVVRAFR